MHVEITGFKRGHMPSFLSFLKLLSSKYCFVSNSGKWMIETQLYFSVPRKCYEYTFNCALWRNCQRAITDEADRENKSPQTTGWHGVDKCPPHKQQQTAVFFAAQCEHLADEQDREHECHSEKGEGQVEGEQRRASRASWWMWLLTVEEGWAWMLGTCSGSASLGHSKAQASQTALFGEWHFKTIYTYIFHINAAWEHTIAL